MWSACLGVSPSSLNKAVCTRRLLTDEVGASSRSRSRTCPARGLPHAAPAAEAAARCGLPLAVTCPFAADGPPNCSAHEAAGVSIPEAYSWPAGDCFSVEICQQATLMSSNMNSLCLTFELGVVSASMARPRGVRRPRAANWGVLVPPLIRLPAAPIPASLGVASDRVCRSTQASASWEVEVSVCSNMLMQLLHGTMLRRESPATPTYL